MILTLIVLLAASCAAQVVGTRAVATPAPAGSSTLLPAATSTAAPMAAPTRLPEPSSAPTPAPTKTPPPAPPRAPAATPAAAPLPAATTTAAAPAAGARTYASAALGISFNYLPDQDGRTIRVLEQGDRIYVYYTNAAPVAGQWVQVFRKPAGESLVDAITRVIMPGYPVKDCLAVKMKEPVGPSQGPNYEYAGIAVRTVPGESQEDALPRWRTCPRPYTVVGGIGYFQADKLHPDRFVFFSIGQYYILAGEDLPWQATVRFQ